MNAATDATRKTTPLVAGIPTIVLTPVDAVEIAVQGLAALDFAHSKGVLHRDIKPGNIMIERDHNGQLVAKLMDFGIGKALGGDDRAPQMTNVTMAGGPGPGTPAYMAPEQIDPARFGQAGPRADLYALGITLFEMLALQLPFGGTYTELLHAHTNLNPPDLREHSPHLSQELAAVLAKALRKAPADRYQSAHEFRLDVQAAALGTGGTMLHGTHAPGAYGAPVRPARSRRVALPLSLAATALITFGGVFAYYSLRPAPKPAPVEPVLQESTPTPEPPARTTPPAPSAELDPAKQETLAKEASTKSILPVEPLQRGEVPEFDRATDQLASAQRAESEQQWELALASYREASRAFDSAAPLIEAFKTDRSGKAAAAAAAAQTALDTKGADFKKVGADLTQDPGYAEIASALDQAQAAQGVGRHREAEQNYALASGRLAALAPSPRSEPKPDPTADTKRQIGRAEAAKRKAEQSNSSDPNFADGETAMDRAQKLFAEGDFAASDREAKKAQELYGRVKPPPKDSDPPSPSPSPSPPPPPSAPPADAKAKADAVRAQTKASNAKQDLGIDKKHSSYGKAGAVANQGDDLFRKGDFVGAKAKFDEATRLYDEATN